MHKYSFNGILLEILKNITEAKSLITILGFQSKYCPLLMLEYRKPVFNSFLGLWVLAYLTPPNSFIVDGQAEAWAIVADLDTQY